MQTITLPHCTQFAYCNGFTGPITELLPKVFISFNNPYQVFLNPQEENPSSPYFKPKQVHLGSICVDIKHSMGLCEGLAQGDQEVLLTEYTIACPVIFKSQNTEPSNWIYYQTHYQMHSVHRGPGVNSNHLPPKERAELNEDRFLRELGYECLELKQFEVVKNLIAMGNDPQHFKNLKALLKLSQALRVEEAPPKSIEAQLNDRHCWESLCLVIAEGNQALAHYILKHFCTPPIDTEKLKDPRAIEHLKNCLEKACTAAQVQEAVIKNEANSPDLKNLDACLSICGDFPCKDCINALEHLGHSSLAEELRALQGPEASLKPK